MLRTSSVPGSSTATLAKRGPAPADAFRLPKASGSSRKVEIWGGIDRYINWARVSPSAHIGRLLGSSVPLIHRRHHRLPGKEVNGAELPAGRITSQFDGDRARRPVRPVTLTPGRPGASVGVRDLVDIGPRAMRWQSWSHSAARF